MKINRNNAQQLSQFSSESASLKKQQTQSTQAFERIKPFPIGKGIVLSISGRIARRCECSACLVIESKADNFTTTWLCNACGKPRLVQRRKSDAELISELLGHRDLKGWDKLFTATLAKAEKLAFWQQQKIQAIAEKLGIGLEVGCSPSELEGGKS